jgi:hypothetical protein
MRSAFIFLLFISLRSSADVRASLPLDASQGVRLAADKDNPDYFDPFADYSEFEDSSDEESETNFLRNGRFFTIGFGLGQRGFTSEMGGIYQSGIAYGIFLTYFFQLGLAFQLGYSVGDHDLSIKAPTQEFKGSVNLTATAFHLKYFFRSVNVIRRYVSLNPFFIGGMSQIYRTFRLSGTSAYAQDGATSFDAGVGFEAPFMKGKMFVGLQLLYHFVKFGDEDSEIRIKNSDTGVITGTGVFPRGDVYSLGAILGINF